MLSFISYVGIGITLYGMYDMFKFVLSLLE
jgi:hypothetical protein